MSDTDRLLYTLYAFAFVFGTLWGSFLNVVIYRVPAGLSVVRPASRCPSCQTPIRARDNIPILSWLLLRGRCRTCEAKISVRYPLIELLVGLLGLALAVHVFGPRLGAVLDGRAELLELVVPWLVLFAWFCALVALFFIDLDVTELPPEITVPGILLGILYAYAVPEVGLVADLVPNVGLVDALLGAVIGGGVILLLIVGYYVLRGRIGLGFGDIWMMAMVGAFLGWQGLFFIYLASSLQGVLVALVAVLVGRLRGTDAHAGSLFRNEEIAEMERELGLREAKTDDSAAPAGDNASQAPAPAAAAEDEGDAPAFGQLAIPFGPFIALSAVEYVFVGGWFMRLLTGGQGL